MKYKENNYAKVSLPELSKMKVKKGYSFLEHFEAWFIARYGRESAKEIYQDLWLTPEYYKKLEAKELAAIKKKWPDISSRAMQFSLGMSMLDAPMVFSIKPPWAEDNLGYIQIKEE